MSRKAIRNVPLDEVLRHEIALPLQQMMKIYTVGNFVAAWCNPDNQERIARIFDTPEQAQHAAAVCANWMGARLTFTPMQLPVTGWWRSDESAAAA
jgi:hypothetical protein